MELLGQLAQGFVAALTPMNLLMCLLGVVLGQIIGVLPGIGPSAAIALLLPLTYGASPTAAIIMFAGIYYGAQYGGTLTSVLFAVGTYTLFVKLDVSLPKGVLSALPF